MLAGNLCIYPRLATQKQARYKFNFFIFIFIRFDFFTVRTTRFKQKLTKIFWIIQIKYFREMSSIVFEVYVYKPYFEKIRFKYFPLNGIHIIKHLHL